MPTDTFLSPKQKLPSKEERRYQDAVDIKSNVTTNLYAVALDTFHNCFVQFIWRCKKCVTVKEEHFERKENKTIIILFHVSMSL